jgi:GNAT superfamily N-acetyltransferase
VASEYPAHWEADVVLRDGRTCHVRPIRPDDSDRLVTFHSRLSAETIYFRFFAPYPELSDRDVARFVNVDYSDRVALVATAGGELIAVARFDRLNSRDAEVAFVVRDDHQGKGIGRELLTYVTYLARKSGLLGFTAQVLMENRQMLQLFEKMGFIIEKRADVGVYELKMSFRE